MNVPAAMTLCETCRSLIRRSVQGFAGLSRPDLRETLDHVPAPGAAQKLLQSAVVDVYYPPQGGAYAALVIASGVDLGEIIEEHVVHVPEVAPYQPGNFFLRELPALRAVLGSVAGIDLIFIDGYVTLDPHGRPGLGAFVHREFGKPVVGVAKSRFRSATHAVATYRGNTAKRPLYVTAAGIELDQAVRLVQGMAGPHRIPDPLKRADQLSRTVRP